MWLAKNGKGRVVRRFETETECKEFCERYNMKNKVSGFSISSYRSVLFIAFYCKKYGYQKGRKNFDLAREKALSRLLKPEIDVERVSVSQFNLEPSWRF